MTADPPATTPAGELLPGAPGPIGVYPGSFDPPTVAHLAVAEAAMSFAGLARVDLVISRTTLGKEGGGATLPEERLEVLLAVAASRAWLGVRISEAGLIAEIASGYDVVVMGADKWEQVRDPRWYAGSEEARDAAVSRLPRVLVAPRAGHRLTAAGVAPAELLGVDPVHLGVSSTAVRSGRHDWMLPEAVAWSRARRCWGVAPSADG